MAMTEQAYKEILEQASTFNTKLLFDRRYRLPFLDNQTGVAQTNCHLFLQRRQRASARKHGQLLSYPANRWKRKHKSTLWDLKILKPVQEAAVVDEPVDVSEVNTTIENEEGESNISTPSSNQTPRSEPLIRENSQPSTTVCQLRDSAFYDIYDDDLDDIPDTGEVDDIDSDCSEYDEKYGNRKKKKKGQSKGKKRSNRIHDVDKEEDVTKPYACERSSPRKLPSAVASPTPVSKPRAQMNPYCDFCMGDQTENKKSGKPEELVSCGDCGRSGHPSCLMFTPNMIISVKKYRWQCIECKSCGLCGTSDNDDQLLFCDDCDRGYHMYCLNPPLQEPPEGNWSCHLCIAEFGDRASIRQQQDRTQIQSLDHPNGTRNNGLEPDEVSQQVRNTEYETHRPTAQANGHTGGPTESAISSNAQHSLPHKQIVANGSAD